MYRYFLQKDCSQHLQPQQLDFMQQNPSAIHSGTGPIFILLLHDMLSVFQHLHVQWKLWQTKIKPHSKHLMWHVLFFDEKSELKHPAICCLLWLCFLYHYSGKENTCTPLPDKQWSLGAAGNICFAFWGDFIRDKRQKAVVLLLWFCSKRALMQRLLVNCTDIY